MVTLGEDYSSGPYYITVVAGMTHLSFNVSILDDKILEEDENFVLTIDPSSLPCRVTTGNHNQATVTIPEDECKGLIFITIYSSYIILINPAVYLRMYTYVANFSISILRVFALCKALSSQFTNFYQIFHHLEEQFTMYVKSVKL